MLPILPPLRAARNSRPAAAGVGGEDQRTTFVIRVSGRFRVDLSEESVTLERQGDYSVWGPKIDYSWQALDDSTVITVRWPSLPN